MNPPVLVILLYAATILFLLGGYLFYLQFSSLHWDESEIRFLERMELHLAHILRLLEAPDTRMLLKKPQSRRRLFLDFSSYLKEDVMDLLRSKKLGLAGYLVVAIFFLSYYSIRLKAHISCGRNDLRFLTGLALALFRRLEEEEEVELD